MKIAASGTQGSMNNVKLDVDLNTMSGSKANLSRTGVVANPSNTDRGLSQAVPNQEMRADNDSQLSKRTTGAMDLDQISISQPKNVMEVQKKLINRGKSVTMNPIAAHNTFDTVGSNGIFQASPSVVKFAGFEANKTHTFKVRVINNSPAP